MKNGFTLTEVLITLGIIGIVAAMTLPSILSNQRKKVAETKLAKIYSIMNQAITLSEVENGEKESWLWNGLTTSQYEDTLEWYNKYLAKYIKTTKIEKTNTSKEYLFLYFADGSILQIAPWLKDYQFYTDKQALKNTKTGINNFSFMANPVLAEDKILVAEKYKYHLKKGFEPYAWNWDGTREGLFTTSNEYGCGEMHNAYCTKLIQINGWKIPDDYPLKF